MKEHPAIIAADLSVVQQSIAPARDLLMGAIARGLSQRLARIVELASLDTPPGERTSRVAAYVDLVHYVDQVYAVAAGLVAEDSASAT